MPDLEVIQFTGQNMALLNHRDPGSTILSCGWKAESEKHLVSSSNDYHKLQRTLSCFNPRDGYCRASQCTRLHLGDEEAQEIEGLLGSFGDIN